MDDDSRALLFYQSVVGDGVFGLLGLASDGSPKPRYVTGHIALLGAVEQLKSQRLDTYFLVAGLKKKGNRKGDNIASLRALFVDLDCGPGKPYADQKAAAKSLFGLVQNGDLPAPSWVVNSGGGLHAYWCADTAIDSAAWQPLATALRDKSRALGLHIDEGITIDRCRIMRAPFSVNYKLPHQPRATSILSPAAGKDPKTYTWDALRAALDAPHVALRAAPLGKVSSVFGSDMGDDWEGWASPERTRNGYRMDNLQHHCPLVASVAAVRGDGVSEPLWFRLLALAAYCEDGEAWALGPLSDGDARFTETETRAKFERARTEASKVGANYGPPTCKAFSDVSAECAKCPKFDGWSQKPGFPWRAAAVPVTLGAEDGLMLPLDWLPPGFRRRPSGHIVALEQEETTSSDGQLQIHTAEREFTTDKLNHFRLVVREEGPLKTLVPFIKMKSESNPNAFVTVNAGKMTSGSSHTLEGIMNEAGLLVKLGGHDHMRRLMVELFEAIEINRERIGVSYSEAVSDDRMGFNEDWSKFYYAGRIYERGATKPTTPAIPLDVPSTNAKMLAQALTPQGTAAGSHAALRRYMSGIHPIMTLVLGASLGSILLSALDLPGFMLHMESDTTGSGKTMSLRAAASLWGDPRHLIPGSNSSMLGWQMQMSTMSPLPAILDEIRFHASGSNKKPAPGSFQHMDIKALTEGASGVKLTSSRNMHAPLSWNCFTLSASNASVTTVLDSSDPSCLATSARTLEIDVARYSANLTLDMELNIGLATHTGHVGPAFAQIILDHYSPAKIVKATDNMQAVLLKRLGMEAVPSPLRFRLPAVSLMLVAAQIAVAHHLLPFDLRAMVAHVVVELQRFFLTEREADAENERHDNNLYDALVAFATARPRLQVITMAGHAPITPEGTTEEAVAHFDLDSGELRLRTAPIKKAQRNGSFPDRQMRLSRISEIPVPAGVSMGYLIRHFADGTDYMVPSTRCIVITIPDAVQTRMKKLMASRQLLGVR